jgi:hypothetical protein
VPASLLFQPNADTAYPFFATSALALAAWAGRGRAGVALAWAAGLILGLGMMFSLVFLPIGLTAGLVLATLPGLSFDRRVGRILATGVGFLTVTLGIWVCWRVNPFLIWSWNRHHHGQFYALFPRSYTKWVLVDWLEFAVGVGIPAVVWAVRGLWLGKAPRFVWAALGVLALLDFGGLTLSEVSRLWLPWMPAVLAASACGMASAEPRAGTLAATVALLGIQTLLLQLTLQVMYAL